MNDLNDLRNKLSEKVLFNDKTQDTYKQGWEALLGILKNRYIDAHSNPDFEGDKFKYIFE